MAFLNPQQIDQIQDALMSRDQAKCMVAESIIVAAKDARADAGLLAKANELHASDDIEIDDIAGTSAADNGTWVQAWVWVPNPPVSFEIEPQRNLKAMGDTYFVKCDEDEAENWAVFDTSGDDPELVEDFPSRDAAQAFIDQQEA